MAKKKFLDIKKTIEPTFLDVRLLKKERISYFKETYGGSTFNLFSASFLRTLAFLIFFLLFFSFFGRVVAPADYSFSNKLIAASIQTGVDEEEKNRLEKELAELEEQIEHYQENILKTQKEAKSLKNEIYILENRIKKLNLQIKATQLTIARLNQEIKLQEEAITLKEIEIEREKNLLADTLENLYEKENQSILEITLKNSSLSEFFDDLNSMMVIQESIRDYLSKLKDLKSELEKKKAELIENKNEVLALANVQSLQKKTLLQQQSQKRVLLRKTKGKESLYRKLLEKSQQSAAEIRSRLYELMGIGKPITFGDAVKFAEFASKATGVREALILAVITQESELGKNVGTCNRRGDPPYKSWKKVMKPSRDQRPFQKIVKELNQAGYHFNIDELPVSCPMRTKSGKYYGWGGAMGPAQFLPSTWLLYKDRIAKITGHNPPNPWNVEDAFVACALLLKDNGADNHSWKAEWRAAMKYFAGSVKWQFRFYGDSVMALAAKYQKDIEKLRSSAD